MLLLSALISPADLDSHSSLTRNPMADTTLMDKSFPSASAAASCFSRRRSMAASAQSGTTGRSASSSREREGPLVERDGARRDDIEGSTPPS